MTFAKARANCLLIVLIALLSLPAFAIGVRQSSDNGTGDSLDSWGLLGRTANGKKVMASRQIICPNQNRQNGSCANDDGSGADYLFLFQIQSTSTNVSVNIGKLQGFVKVDGNGGSYGVMICDDALNAKELCTTDPNDPGFSKLSGITFKVKSKTSVSFVVPSFPSFPAGSTPEEGQGVTFFIVTHQSAALPIAYPSLGIN
jgi:hypothetical protein